MWLRKKKKTQRTELMLGYVAIAFAIANVVQHQSIIVTFKSSVTVIVIVMTPNKKNTTHRAYGGDRWDGHVLSLSPYLAKIWNMMYNII